MSLDPIVDELHQQRAEKMERLGFDFESFFRDLKEQEKLSLVPPLSPPDLAPSAHGAHGCQGR